MCTANWEGPDQSDIQVERRETFIIYYIFLCLSILFDFFQGTRIENECVWNILKFQSWSDFECFSFLFCHGRAKCDNIVLCMKVRIFHWLVVRKFAGSWLLSIVIKGKFVNWSLHFCDLMSPQDWPKVWYTVLLMLLELLPLLGFEQMLWRAYGIQIPKPSIWWLSQSICPTLWSPSKPVYLLESF